MLSIRRDHARPPVGGHRWEKDGVRITGNSPDDVIERMVAYRSENGLPLDFPEHELGEYYQKIAPWLVRDDDFGFLKPIEQQVAENCMAQISAHPTLLPLFSPEVETRQKSCKTCAFCSTEIIPHSRYEMAAERKLDTLLGERGSWAFGVCAAHLLPVRLICRTQTPQLRDTPDCCWVKQQ